MLKYKIPCPDCDGTGICVHRNAAFPHSCCGDCHRRSVSWEAVPKGFMGVHGDDNTTVIGTGIIEVGFPRWLRWKITGK